ncbi:hypothetical protein WJX75_008848 [Coccomyxa subellipsoidea]|uniref:Uncharacterized protein n=1 Tax=Coccomyxa subellipsoidea TaxID=248742 RepID=A0ABR2YAB0_9CHLO
MKRFVHVNFHVAFSSKRAAGVRLFGTPIRAPKVVCYHMMSHLEEKGSLQKAFRQRRKEKLEADELHLQDLSKRVNALELERERLQRALKSMTNTEQDTQGPTGAQELPDNGEMAVALCFGESAAQLQLTKGGIRAISLDTTAAIWKTLVQKMAFFLDKVDAAPMDDHSQAIVHEGGSFVWALSEHNPRMLTALTTCNVEAPSAHAVDWEPGRAAGGWQEDAFWRDGDTDCGVALSVGTAEEDYRYPGGHRWSGDLLCGGG